MDLADGPLRRLLELLNTQVKGSVQWVLLEISSKLALPDIQPKKKRHLANLTRYVQLHQ